MTVHSPRRWTLKPFTYLAPRSLAEAVQLVTEYGSRARALAGGTDLLVQLRAGLVEADAVIDLKHVPELTALAYTPDDGLTVGAATPCYRVYQDPAVVQFYPGLVDAASLIGSIQIQGRASVGGNLCNASPSGDTIPALIAEEGVCRIVGPAGERTLPVEAFCLAPRRNALQPGELLVALRFPPPRARTGTYYVRFIPRNEMDIAVAGVGASVTLAEDGETVQAARIALAAVGPTPLVAREASEGLTGQPASEASFQAAGEAAQAAARPITDMRGTIEQRRQLVRVLTVRALRQATERARGALVRA